MIVKICGITRLVDAETVINAGADALSFMFVKHSARLVDVEEAQHISSAIAGQVTRVGVFADVTTSEVQAVLDQVELDALQFHGNETEAFCEQFQLPYLKSVDVKANCDWSYLQDFHSGAQFLLLDTPGGGTGQVFDWAQWPQGISRPLMLAGGLHSDNVGEAIAKLRPDGVDVSGGVEGSIKGIKVAKKINKFVNEVRLAEASL